MPDSWDLPQGQTQYDPKDLHKTLHHKEPYNAHVTEPLEAKQDPTPQKPSIGRIVHFILPDGPSKGEHRPAIIVRVWGSSVNLQVFTDGENDGATYKSGIHWATSVPYADESENKPFSYHWPERV